MIWSEDGGMLAWLVATCGSYLAGSVNFAIVVLKCLGRVDPRTLHSRNAGVTNVARVAGLAPAAIVFVLDQARAVGIEAVVARFCVPAIVPWAGLALIVGNRLPVWHGWRGGKGVANFLGFFGAMHPWGAVAGCAAWLGVYAGSRIPAAASMALVSVIAIATASSNSSIALAPTLLCLVLIVHGHLRNFRALRGSVPQVSTSDEQTHGRRDRETD